MTTPLNEGTVPASVPADDQLQAMAEHWHDHETLGDEACEHRMLEIVAFKAGYRAALATSAPPPEADQLRAGVRQIVTALRDKEWADLLATDPDLLDLEVEVGKLIGARG